MNRLVPFIFICCFVISFSGCSSSRHVPDQNLISFETLQKKEESETAKTAKTPEDSKLIPKPAFTILVGEYMKFSIRWLGFEVGTAEVTVKEITKINGRDAYHIEVVVRSNRLIDLIWPVRDEHHSYVDVEYLHSLQYEKKISEGSYRADRVMKYDQEKHTAQFASKRSSDVKEMLIPEHVQDQLSCTFWFRIQNIKPGDIVKVPVNADEKSWDLEVHVEEIENLDIDGFGKVKAVKMEPFAQFQGMFVRRGRIFGWMSADEHRIPLLMRAKIPKLGTINMVIVEYKHDKIHLKA